MTAIAVMDTVLQSRCIVDGVVYLVDVSAQQTTPQGSVYHAVAFVSVDGAARQGPVVNDRGLPLVAIGNSPGKAASFMSAVLRRRHARNAMRRPS